MEDESGCVTTDQSEVLDRWRRDFEGLLKPPLDLTVEQKAFLEGIEASNGERESMFDNDNNSVLNKDFTTEEVLEIVNHAKCSKAPGLDGLLNECVKNENSIKLLTVLFISCLRMNLIPMYWVKGMVNPIPKSKDNNPRVPLNYRGISLLSIVGKLYTSALSKRISSYLESNNKLSNEQNGFHPKRSCLDHIFTLHDLCKVRKSLRQDTFLSFIDFHKASDYVNHNMLYHKLINVGIVGDIYKSIKQIYNDPSSCVQLNGKLSDWFPVSSGVRQGDSLSPTLFSIFIDDLSDEIHDTNAGVYVSGEQLHMLLYADDIVLISPNPTKAQTQLDVLSGWCERWLMKINVKNLRWFILEIIKSLAQKYPYIAVDNNFHTLINTNIWGTS